MHACNHPTPFVLSVQRKPSKSWCRYLLLNSKRNTKFLWFRQISIKACTFAHEKYACDFEDSCHKPQFRMKRIGAMRTHLWSVSVLGLSRVFWIKAHKLRRQKNQQPDSDFLLFSFYSDSDPDSGWVGKWGLWHQIFHNVEFLRVQVASR